MLPIPSHRAAAAALPALLLVLALVAAADARPAYAPLAVDADAEVLDLTAVARHEAEPVDAAAIRVEDEIRARDGEAPRFAVPRRTFLAPDVAGNWERPTESTLLWRLRVGSPGAASLNLGFTRYRMPADGRLLIYPADGSAEPVVFTGADNKDHGELWTPILKTDELVIEVVLPVKERWNLELELTSVNVGYRAFAAAAADKSGACNNDVVCPEGDEWSDEIQSVAAISTGGSIYCTGFMVNNTAQDETPYFMTAHHCNINTISDASLVVYWNYESPVCGQHGGGDLTQFQSGSTMLATWGGLLEGVTDFTLVRLDDAPDESWEVAYAGWDRSGDVPTSTVCIHHPSGDEKSISFDDDPPVISTYLEEDPGYDPGDGTHLRVIDWDDGTTEGGSSGSPLFDQNHRIVGQLHGGWAACGNDESDWYGRFSVSWDGGGSTGSRLRDWLDAVGTGATSVDVLAPYNSGLRVSPTTGLDAVGDLGGPFDDDEVAFTLENRGDEVALDYLVSADAPWVDVTGGSGTLPPGASTTVTVSLNAQASALPVGLYDGVVTITNLTDGVGGGTRPLALQVGYPARVLFWTMDADPGWTRQGDWAFGQPQAGGGEYGNPDPARGATGATVFGYALDGDYPDNMPATHLTTQALDCSGYGAVVLKFKRWLNVERPLYDKASLQVSDDGVVWTTLWENVGEVTDAAWTDVEYDLSDVADGEDAVFIRWTMGATDSSWRYSGWNIDDVELWALQPLTAPIEDEPGDDAPPPAITRLTDVRPNPFNPRAEVAFELARAGRARLAVYDLRGQLVRVLADGPYPAGRHAEAWNGLDDDGRAAASGTYVFRLTTAEGEQGVKALLVR